jgi:hypothetical protein
MALKDLLVYADQAEGARFRLRLAADLACRHKCRLTVLFVREFNQAQLDLRKNAELGLVSAKDLDRLDQHIQSSIDEAADRLRSMMQALGSEHHLEVEWRRVDGPGWASAPQHAVAVRGCGSRADFGQWGCERFLIVCHFDLTAGSVTAPRASPITPRTGLAICVGSSPVIDLLDAGE